MSGGLYSMDAKDFDKTLDLTKVKPYGDTMNDGKVQLSFTLPVPCGAEAVEAAKSQVGWVAGGASGTSAYAKFTYAVTTGWQKVVRPRIRCNSFAAVVWSTSGRWAISKITAVHRGCGRIRR